MKHTVLYQDTYLYIHYNSPGRGRCGMRSAWGGEIGGTGVDNYGSTGTGINAEGTLLPSQRPLTASSGSSKENVLDQVK